MRFSVRLNNDLDLDTYRRIAVTADEAGMDQLWISHDLRWHAAPPIVADLAGHTDRLRLGIGIHNPYTVHPVELAMIASTLDEISGSRFDLGLGAGASGFLDLIGVARSRPLTVMREALTGVRQLLTGSPVTVAHWDPDLALARPAPSVGLWLGATGPRMRALGGELADGVLALALPPEAHSRIVADIEEGLPQRVLPQPPEIPMCVWLSVHGDPTRADRALAEKLEIYGPELGDDLLSEVDLDPSAFRPMPTELPPAMRRLAVVGTPEQVVDQCRALGDHGVGHLSFGPPLGPDPAAAIELLVDEILPRLGE